MIMVLGVFFTFYVKKYDNFDNFFDFFSEFLDFCLNFYWILRTKSQKKNGLLTTDHLIYVKLEDCAGFEYVETQLSQNNTEYSCNFKSMIKNMMYRLHKDCYLKCIIYKNFIFDFFFVRDIPISRQRAYVHFDYCSVRSFSFFSTFWSSSATWRSQNSTKKLKKNFRTRIIGDN